jgi:hypothetical protein
MDYSNHNAVLDALGEAQEADTDNRERARECQTFLAARNGQWETEWADAAGEKRPRYTFDMTEAIVDQVCGDLATYDLDRRVLPMGGESSEDVADTYNGLLRMIESQCHYTGIRRRIRRNAVITGFDAARAVTKYCDGDSFDQDLAYEQIPNAIDRIWFGHHTEQDASDARHAWILTAYSPQAYKREFPNAESEASVTDDRGSRPFMHKQDAVIVGELLYLEEQRQTLVKLSDGTIKVEDDDWQAIKDEYEAAGIEVEDTRTRTVLVEKSRRFNATAWLDDEPRDTVFKHRLSVVPCYGTFDLIDDKIVYRGIIEKVMDAQRVYNYAKSREVEEGALAPRAKTWVTPKQAKGFEKTLRTLNTNNDPVQFFNPDPEYPGVPGQTGGAQINPGLVALSDSMRDIITMATGMFAANMGDNPRTQSGVAIQNLQDRGDRGNNKFLESLECFEHALVMVAMKAIPEVYGPQRQVRLLSQDGTVEVATIGQIVQDRQTGETYVANDVSRGTYEVTVTAAPSYKTRQSQTVSTLTDLAQYDPTLLQEGGDILLSNIPAPGMDDMAARKRAQLLNAGLIPPDQMTPDELEAYQQQMAEAAQNPQETPEMVLARAEQAKADAEAAKAQADLQDAQNKAQETAIKYRLEAEKLAVERARLQLEAFKAELQAQKLGAETRNIFATMVKTLAEAEKVETETDMADTRVTELFGGAA